MTVTIYGDFNCPYSYLASQRADRLRVAGVAVDWRAVEHDRRLPATGLSSGGDQASWARELAEVASLALAGEQVPAGPPAVISNTEAAVAATPRQSATASLTNCAAACSAPSGCRD